MSSITLGAAIEEYIRYRAPLVAANTLRGDRRVTSHLHRIIGELQVASITDAHIAKFFAARNVATSTRNLDRDILRVFFDWTIRRHYRRGNPIRPGERGREKERAWNYVPVEEFGALLDAAPNPRDRAIIALGLTLFLRESEVRQLKLGDVDLASTVPTVRITVQKSGRVVTRPIPEELQIELRTYLTWYAGQYDISSREAQGWALIPRFGSPPHAYNPITGGFDAVGPARINPRLPLVHVGKQVKKVLAVLGYDAPREGEHTLRRSGARALYHVLVEDTGHDGAIRMVQVLLHHANVTTTEGYLGLDGDSRRVERYLTEGPMFRGRTRAAEGGSVTPFRRRA